MTLAPAPRLSELAMPHALLQPAQRGRLPSVLSADHCTAQPELPEWPLRANNQMTLGQHIPSQANNFDPAAAAAAAAALANNAWNDRGGT